MMVAEESGNKRTTKGQSQRRSGRDQRRAPVTIDLKAQKVEDKVAETGQSAATAAAAKSEAKSDAASVQSAPAASKPEASTKPGASAASKTDALAAKPDAAAPKSEPARSEPPAEKADAPSRPPGGGRSQPPWPPEGWLAYGAAGVVGGIVALVLVLIVQVTGLVPSPGRSSAGQALEQAQGASDTAAALERRVMALEAMTQSLPASMDRLDNMAGTVTTLQATDKSLEAVPGEVDTLKTTVADLGSKVGAADAATQKSLDDLTQRVNRLAAATASGTSSAAPAEAVATLSDQISAADANLKALSGRVDALDKTVAGLQASSATGVDRARAARAVAMSSLRRAAGTDAPFTDDLGMLSALGVSGDAVDGLQPLAASGVPSTAELAAEFPRVADAILAATTTTDPEAGFLEKLVGSAGGLVSIRPAGPVAGDDPPAIVSRMQAAVDKGDLAEALKERAGLPDAGQQASAEWAAAAANRVKVDSLVDQVAQTLDAPSTN